MADFTGENMAGAGFEDVDLSGARFHSVNLADSRYAKVTLQNARLSNIDFRGVVLRGVWAVDVEVDGYLENFRVNGVDVAPLVEAELNRRDPDRAAMFSTDPGTMREAWAVLERRWAATVERARALPPDLLHERVEGEWSFIETLRHLVFATDAWVSRALLGEPSPWSPLGLPHDEMEHEPAVPNDPAARPPLDEMLALRADRMGTVREVLAGLTAERLAGMTTPVTEPGYPAPESYPVQRCLRAILVEEWEHRLFAERDLAVLEARSS